jgi:hypothetical protein
MASASIMLEPSAAEIDDWVEQERQRREAWLSGPTAEERAAWTERERERRMASLKAEQAAETVGSAPFGLPSLREAQLAAEGAMSLAWKELTAEGAVGMFRKWSSRGLAALVNAGREWEAASAQPSRRRVPSDSNSGAP